MDDGRELRIGAYASFDVGPGRSRYAQIRDLVADGAIDRETAAWLLERLPPGPIECADEEFLELVRQARAANVVHETHPYELDVCEVCEAIIRDADRQAHGCFAFRGRFSFETRVSFELLRIARADIKEGRLIRSLQLGAELFNALDSEIQDPWWVGRPRQFVRGPFRPFDREDVWLQDFRCNLDRALPIWALRIMRIEPLRPSEAFFGVDRELNASRLAGQRLDVRSAARILKDLWPQRQHPAYRREYQAHFISGNALRTSEAAAENLVRVAAVDREGGRITLEGGGVLRLVDGAPSFDAGQLVRVVTEPDDDSAERLRNLWRAELVGSYESFARALVGSYESFARASRIVTERVAPFPIRVDDVPRPNRAQRRGRIDNDGSNFNGTPRELRVTRKRGR